ncbi:nucleotide sugar dehydrogenase [Candidatus Woesearchaeota archaeon]|nr:nucleotide sugar dehydrogenase [Candidatus Woesearchaeota archaeon]
MHTELRKKLLSGEKKIGIWGLGYIGFSSMAYFAKEGVSCIGTDIIKERVDRINTVGKSHLPNMDFWLGFDTLPLVKSKLMYATTDWKELICEDVAVHLVAIPTEREGKPYDDILVDVMTKLFTSYKKFKPAEPPLIIIESTLTPNRVDTLILPMAKKHGLRVGKDILLGVAPRRDWFVSPDKTLKTLPRVVGGTDPYTTDLIAEVLGIVSDTVLKATDHNHACIVKSIENAFRQVDITLANQFSLAYPHLNMTEILKLAGTKWNINTYHPSFGTGGYCIPLAPQYVLEGAKHPEVLTILKASLETDFSQPQRVAKSVAKRGFKNIGILGLAYTGDIKVAVLSPTIALVKEFKKLGIKVRVNDPLFTPDEIKEHTGAEAFEFPTGMNEFDAILIVAPHMQYKSIPYMEILDNLRKCKFILDNMGVWKHLPFEKHGIEYHEAGDAHWLEVEKDGNESH